MGDGEASGYQGLGVEATKWHKEIIWDDGTSL